MPKIMKVLDKGGVEVDDRGRQVMRPKKVLERYSLDAHEIVKSDPDRFSIVDDDTEAQENVQGDRIVPGKRRRLRDVNEEEF